MTADLIVDQNLTAAFGQLLKLGRDQSAAMAEIATMMVSRSRENFRKQSDPLGVPWRQSERAKTGNGKTLLDRGHLFAAIKQNHGPNFAEAGPATGGASQAYAAIHQFGGRIAAKNGKALRTPFGPRASVTMPARPYLGWNPVMKKEAADILATHLRNALAAKGAR